MFQPQGLCTPLLLMDTRPWGLCVAVASSFFILELSCCPPQRHPLNTKLKWPPSGIFSKMFYQVFFIIIFFLEIISFLKKDARHVSSPHQYGPFSLNQAGLQTRKKRICIWSPMDLATSAGCLLCSHAIPPPRQRRGVTILGVRSCWRTEKTRRGSIRKQDIYMASHRARQEKQTASKWNLNDVIFREKNVIWNLLFVYQRIKFYLITLKKTKWPPLSYITMFVYFALLISFLVI